MSLRLFIQLSKLNYQIKEVEEEIAEYDHYLTIIPIEAVKRVMLNTIAKKKQRLNRLEKEREDCFNALSIPEQKFIQETKPEE